MIYGKVIRQRSTLYGTPGNLVLPFFACDTLELPWADNRRGMSCICADIYRGRVWFSPTFKRNVIRFEDKNGRRDVLIHNANFAATVEDTDNDGKEGADLDGDGIAEVFQLRGCTAVGNGYGDIQRKDGKMQWGIKSSIPTLQNLINYLEDSEQLGGFHQVEITYEWAEGCEP